jgi:thioredoxin 2
MSHKLKLVCVDCSSINQFSIEKIDSNPKCGICHKPLFYGKPIAVNSDQVKRHIAHSGLPVVVDFWAPWCGPCLSFAPIYQAFAESVGTQLRVLKLDTEANGQAGIDFNIRSIPTIRIVC